MTEEQIRKRRRIVLVYLYCLWSLWAVYCVLTETPAETDSGRRLASCAFLVLALGCQLGFMWFCTLDARLVDKPLPQLARIGIFIAWPVAVPIYLFWARRFKGMGVLLLHGFLMFLVYVVVGVIGFYIHDSSFVLV